MLGGTATSDIGRIEGVALDGIARLLLASLYHELDDIHVDGCSEDSL